MLSEDTYCKWMKRRYHFEINVVEMFGDWDDAVNVQWIKNMLYLYQLKPESYYHG
jgi:hypothetical protein